MSHARARVSVCVCVCVCRACACVKGQSHKVTFFQNIYDTISKTIWFIKLKLFRYIIWLRGFTYMLVLMTSFPFRGDNWGMKLAISRKHVFQKQLVTLGSDLVDTLLKIGASYICLWYLDDVVSVLDFWWNGNFYLDHFVPDSNENLCWVNGLTRVCHYNVISWQTMTCSVLASISKRRRRGCL